MMAGRRILSAGLLFLVLLPGCASIEAKPAAGLAGTWEGRSSGAAGLAPARLIIKEDGSYAGTLTMTVEERTLRGAIVTLGSGAMRWSGNHGDGSVVMAQRDGRRTLRFQRDDGGAALEVAERAP
jgi:hypothetical protein